MKRAILLLVFVALTFSAYVEYTELIDPVSGTAGNNTIFYSSNFFNIQNVANPITLQIVFNSSDEVTATICLNSQQSTLPIAGNNLNNLCPNGSLAILTNSSSAAETSKLKFSRKNTSLRGQLLSKIVDDTTPAGNIYATPTNETASAGFVVTVNSPDPVSFSLYLSGSYCSESNEVAVNGSCATLTEANTNGDGNTIVLDADSWSFYYFKTPEFDSTLVNQVSVAYNITSNIYIQQNYIPSPDWFLTTEKNGNSFIINTPGTTQSGNTYFVGVWNPSLTDTLYVALNVTYSVCNDNFVGPNCAVNQTATNSTNGDNVILLDASIDPETYGSATAYDLSGSDNAFAYFQLYNLPVFEEPPPYYVRVSVGNTDLEDDNENYGPEILAKKFGFPSLESFDYSSKGAVANQVVLPVTNPATDVWFVAVQLPSDFSIWIGVNCANCSSDHGTCYCSTADGSSVDCQSLGANSTNNYYPLYATLPTSTSDSAGYCDCSDDDYQYSFDCSQKSSPTVLFIVLIVIGGLIILFVAIGVPLYCYISNKRKERYERL